MSKPFRVSILISGGGTTLRNLIETRSAGKLGVEMALVVSNRADAGGLQFANDEGIPYRVIDHRGFDTLQAFSADVFAAIRDAQTDLVIMGGFLRRLKIPADFTNRVINIHPSLIPAFCGKGMYGRRVHQAVIDYGCKFSGCTVHFVDDEYDHGPIIAQMPVPVLPNDDAQSLAERVFEAECQLYPRVIQGLAQGQVQIDQRRVTWEANHE